MVATWICDLWDGARSFLTSGPGVALFAFGLAIGWEVYKNWRYRQRRDRATLVMARDETAASAATVLANTKIVAAELETLNQQNIVANLVYPIEPGVWDSFKLDPPAAALADASTLSMIRKASTAISKTNELIRSRELFRATRLPTQNPGDLEQLKSYDELVLESLIGVARHLERLLPRLIALAGPLERGEDAAESG